MADSTWAAVLGYEGLYEVSDTGTVRSVARTIIRSNGRPHTIRSKMRSTSTNPKGYKKVTLIRDATHRTHMVHALVLEAFVRQRPTPEHVVRHINGDPADNRLANLAWGTPSENQQDSLLHGTHAQAAKTQCPRGHPYSGPNVRISQGSRVCVACMREYAQAHLDGRAFDPEKADARYADVVAGRRRRKPEPHS